MTTTKPPRALRARLTSQGQITVPQVNVLDFAGVGRAAAARIPATAEELDAALEANGAERAAKRDARSRSVANNPRHGNGHD